VTFWDLFQTIANSLHARLRGVHRHRGIRLATSTTGANGYDAISVEGKRVQVKANYAATQIGFRGEADMLLCLKIDLTGDWTEIYYGDFGLVKKAARYLARDNKHMVAITALLKIAKAGYILPAVLSGTDETPLTTSEPI
jgi:hypothetical protein